MFAETLFLLFFGENVESFVQSWIFMAVFALAQPSVLRQYFSQCATHAHFICFSFWLIFIIQSGGSGAGGVSAGPSRMENNDVCVRIRVDASRIAEGRFLEEFLIQR